MRNRYLGTHLEVRQMSHRDVRKYFFSLRVVKKWNDLKEMVEADSTYSFKNRYNRANKTRREGLGAKTRPLLPHTGEYFVSYICYSMEAVLVKC